MAAFLDLLGVYLVPFALGLPVALGLYWVTTRRQDPTDERRPSGASPVTAAGQERKRHAPAPRSEADEIPTEPALPQPAPAALARVALDAASASAAAARQGLPEAGAAAAAPVALLPGQPGAEPAAPKPATPPQAAAPLAAVIAAAVQAPAQAPPETEPAGDGEPPLILVADDSAVVRAKLRRLLENAGYRVALAGNGAEALAMLPQQRYDLLITDLEMPEMDGFEVIALVRGGLETEDLPMLAITGHEALSARVHDCQGLYGIFRKPWHDRELLQRVAAISRLRHGRVAQPAAAPATPPAAAAAAAASATP